jgi:hypothetical protein
LPTPSTVSLPQKNFIILVTGGIGSRDDFDAEVPTSTSHGFTNFANLIGDYYAGRRGRDGGSLVTEDSRYLDDIAKYMQDNATCAPTSPTADRRSLHGRLRHHGCLRRLPSARVRSRQAACSSTRGTASSCRDAIVAALNDIVEKARSFTAATVPSSRTADGSDLYNSFFIPSGDHAFWEGHLRSWHFSASGQILDSAGHCALEDPDGGCNGGPFKKICQPGESWPVCVTPYWDVGDATKAALTPGYTNADTTSPRQLFTSKLNTATPPRPVLTNLDQNLNAADMNILTFAAPPDPAPESSLYIAKGSLATNEQGLADEVVAYARGCFFGTGALANVSTVTPCSARPWLIGDIFHSDPIVVRQPPDRVLGTAYTTFRNAYMDRDRIIYTGTNGGFLEGFNAGSWVFDSPSGTYKYNQGNGVEKFGFMPWTARKFIKNQTIDDPTSRSHYVDGAPQVADAWLYNTYTDTTENAADWRTILAGGLREGGRQYYALDISNPSNDSGAPAGNLPFPNLQWEFPNEDDFNKSAAGTGCGTTYPCDWANMGQTWGQPVMTRVKLNAGANTVERWVAIVTGGYEETSDPNPNAAVGGAIAVDATKGAYNAASTKGRAIYMVDLKNGKVIAQQKMGYNGDADATTTPESGLLYAIPSTPAVLDLDADGYADVVYVGDLGGNLWKWVIKPTGEDRVNDGSSVRTQPAWKFHKFFEAPPTKISGTPRYWKNIFQPPAAAYVNGKLWLAFGTGRARGDRLPRHPQADHDWREPLLRDQRPRSARDSPGYRPP